MNEATTASPAAERVEVRSGPFVIDAMWREPAGLLRAAVVFAHDPTCQDDAPLATALAGRSFASLLPDLLKPAESHGPDPCRNVEMISQRLRMTTRWTERRCSAPIVVLGRARSADAALIAAGVAPEVRAVVAIAPAFDLPLRFLERVTVPVLLVEPREDRVSERRLQAIRQVGRVDRVVLDPISTDTLADTIAAWRPFA